MKNKLQPTRTSFSRNFQCKKAPRRLSKFFHFGTENRADQLKKTPCRYSISPENTRGFTRRTCRVVKQFPRQTTGTVSPSWLHVSIVYQCSMHVVTTASHVEQYLLNTQWISSLMRSLWEQIWLGTIWLWEHFWFLSQPLRSGGNRQILGGCWRGLNIRPSIKCRPPFL